ncbi:MAG: F0F1 ATP synthase subunit alpha [Candidatus Levybacteria bacterium]|nr:F0F1 ATP synthase subunit alpha [Candidatus Levybacteria bacterium]
MIDSSKIIEKLEKGLMTFSAEPKMQSVGKVEKNTDGIIVASGLYKAQMGEQVVFEGGALGMVLNLSEDYASIALLSAEENLKRGGSVKTTGRMTSINVSSALLGRVINPLGEPLDGKARIKHGELMPIEAVAASVVEREPVNVPLKTGIKAIDAMIPIGRGQRELIIGDRGLGKTAIAIDSIINQKQNKKPVTCIYVAIGQKQSSVAQVVDKLLEEGAMNYTIVVAAGASDPAPLQYLAPYAGVAIAEYFLKKGEDSLIVYDDLTKHAWAYRQISLVLRRPAGREAYPGDIFYLHSRLLERAVKLNSKNGGGSITALPIIETQGSDISAYIPTNVISITDGQIYLQSDLFNSGIRPAINIGNSVSRVGGSAQTGATKSVAGKTRLELAQYAELAAFAQFGSELDEATLSQLERGKRTTEILKQPQYHPLPEHLEVLSIFAVTNGLLDSVLLDDFQKFEQEYHQYMIKNHMKIIEELSLGQKITERLGKDITEATEKFKKTFVI